MVSKPGPRVQPFTVWSLEKLADARPRQRRPAQAGIHVDVGTGARHLGRCPSLEARVADLGQQADDAALGELVVDAAVDRAQNTAAAATVERGGKSGRVRFELVDRTARAKGCADIETGPDRTEISGGNGDRLDLRHS